MKKKPTRKRVSSPFSKNLQAILDERGLSQKAASEVAGVSTTTINDWLAGSQPSDPIAVQRPCKALKCDFEWLLTGEKTRIDAANAPLSEPFDIKDESAFSGIFEISAKRLTRKGQK